MTPAPVFQSDKERNPTMTQNKNTCGTRPRFATGQVVITRNAANHLTPAEINRGIARHIGGDWGSISPEDATTNEGASECGDRLLSAYGEGNRRFWIITEADRSVTTILLLEDY
jgi:hypothetical protein